MKIMFLVLVFLSSCTYDRIYKITTFKNNSNLNLAITYGSDKMNDTVLFYMSKYPVDKHSSVDIIGPPPISDSIITFFLFNNDTVINRIKLGLINGIVEKSFIKKIEINSDSLKVNGNVSFP